MSTLFPIILPATMAIIACALVLLSRLDLPAALGWGIGFCLSALGFATSATISNPHAAALVGDVLSVAAFYCYAGGFLLHFSLPLYRRERLAFAAIYLIMDFYVVLRLESPYLELLLNDIAASCLLGFALGRVMNRARSLVDRAAVLAGSVAVIDNLLRVLIFIGFANSSERLEDFPLSSYAQAMQVTTSVIALIFAVSIAAALINRIIGRRRDAAERDPLTRILNRRGFDQSLEGIRRRGKLAGAVLICDIDHFKQVNDQYGHASGDLVIQALASMLKATLPPNAVVARFGGEEFVAFVPDSSLAEGGILAQALRARFAAQDWRQTGIDRQITASFGVAKMETGDGSAWAALKRADRALYDAKAAGRNRVVWDGGDYEPGGSVVDIQQTIRKGARRASDAS